MSVYFCPFSSKKCMGSNCALSVKILKNDEKNYQLYNVYCGLIHNNELSTYGKPKIVDSFIQKMQLMQLKRDQ